MIQKYSFVPMGRGLFWYCGIIEQEHFSFVFLFGNNSKTIVGKIGKSVIGGTIDTISNVDSLDGMWLGVKAGALGGHPVEGAFICLTVGTLNLIGSAVAPEFKKSVYDGAKNFAYGAVDVVESGVESIGKGIHCYYEPKYFS